MKTFAIALAVMITFGGTAMARSAVSGKVNNAMKRPNLAQCDAMPSYLISGTLVTVISAEQHPTGATWILDLDGMIHELSVQGQTAMLSSERDGLLAGWTSRGGETRVFDAEGLLEHDGTLGVVAEFYDEVVAALLDPDFINALGQDSFSAGDRNPWVIFGVIFVASCVEFNASESTTVDENGCETTTSEWSVGWDCPEMPFGSYDGDHSGSGSSPRR